MLARGGAVSARGDDGALPSRGDPSPRTPLGHPPRTGRLPAPVPPWPGTGGAGQRSSREGREHPGRSVRPKEPRPGLLPRPVYVRPPRPRRLIPRGNPGRRLGVTLLAIIFVLTLFAARLVQLQGLEADRYRILASQQRDRTIPLPALRGSITGANGEVLAMTVETYLVYADPPLIPVADQTEVATKLAAYLSLPAYQILDLIQHPTSPQYVVLAKGVSAQVGGEITRPWTCPASR